MFSFLVENFCKKFFVISIVCIMLFMLRQIGRTGLKQWGGYVREEFLTELSGEGWKRVVPRMMSDPILSASLLAIELLIRQTTWSVVPADETAAAVAMAEFVDQCRHGMKHSWDECLSNILSMLPWGFSLLELTYKRRSDGRLSWASWDIRGQDSLDGWKFGNFDEIEGVYQRHPETWERLFIPSEKFLLFRVTAPKNNPEGRSVLRGAYEPWYYGSNMRRVEAIAAERDATGLPLARIPAAVIAAGGNAYNSYEELVTNLRVDEQAGVIIPSDYDEFGRRLYDLELLKSGERSVSLDPVITRYDQKMATALLTDVLMVGIGTSSGYNLAQQKQELLTTSINGYLDSIAGTINGYAITRLLKLNGMPAQVTPRLSFNRVETINLDELGLFIQRIAQAGFEWAADPDIDRRLREQADLT